MNHSESGTKYYEISYVFSPTLSEEELMRAEEELRVLIDDFKGHLESWDSPKRRFLPYEIKKHTEGYFGALRFTLPVASVNGFKEKIAEKKTILRSMFLEWKKAPARRMMKMHKPTKEEQVPTDEKALDEKLEEILAKNI